MEFIDQIFIINYNSNKWDDCEKYLIEKNIKNYTKVDFIKKEFNSLDKRKYENFSHKYLKMKNLIKNTNDYIQFEYFLKETHLNIINISIEKKYNNILVLEDNFSFIDNFNDKFSNILKDAENNYFGFLYLSDLELNSEKIFYNDNLFKINGIHDTFAICYNKRIFNNLKISIEESKCEYDKLLFSKFIKKYMVFVSNSILIVKRDNNNIINEFNVENVKSLKNISKKFRNFVI
jgi:hypothetical protein